MKNEDNIITQFEFFPKGKEKVPLLGVGVTIGTGFGQLVRIAHADQIACDQTAKTAASRHHVAPQIDEVGLPC
jgi:hypothetical protein